MEKEAEEEEKPVAKEEEEKAKEQRQGPTAAKEQQQDDDDDEDDDDERYDMVAKILVYEGKCVKAFRVIGNLNNSNTKMIMTNIAPHNEIRTKYFIQLNH